MLPEFKFFDPYGLKARVFPAIIAGLPAWALVIVLVPWSYVGLPHAIAAAALTVLLFAFADFARRVGRKVEEKLGTRSTPELFHCDNTVIDAVSKQRYRAFLAERIGQPAPTEGQEKADIQTANQFYMSAANWLREHTRDTKKFYLLFADNITYGFRRNLLGLKMVALAGNLLVLVICAGLLAADIVYLKAIPGIIEKLGTVAAAAILHSVYMALAVNPSAVRDASLAYGRQLILCCEILMGGSPQKKPRQRKVEK